MARRSEELNEWLAVIQHAISEGLNAQMSSGATEEGQKVLTQLRSKPGNAICADCGCADPDSVTWASINLGVMLCLDCSGIHRRLGTHVSKVRSGILDVKQWTPELMEVFDSLGAMLLQDICL